MSAYLDKKLVHYLAIHIIGSDMGEFTFPFVQVSLMTFTHAFKWLVIDHIILGNYSILYTVIHE